MLDNEITEALRQGDRQAFTILFRKYFKMVVAYAMGYVQNQHLANDLAQESFMALWKNRFQLPPKVSIKSYLFKTVYNRYIDHIRRQQLKVKVLDEVKYERLIQMIPEDSSRQPERLARLRAGIEKLPPKCREILLLSKKDRLGYKEIADHLGVSVKTVESQMRIAYTKLREYLK